ncbi:MAG: type II toxin-antitoxin system RelE/ParE family toxin [Actinomycetota bacterium]|jgi:mRNA interferase RelE/StbE|nr:type II toxin-antitoxin system RelE/ParE family toxin [Actinomycetota bacterium]
MMGYSSGVERRAQEQIARLSTQAQNRVESSLKALADDPRPRGIKSLQGRSGHRLRVGNYRLIYEVDDS